MTIIIGALDGKGGVVMGADSVGVNPERDLQLRRDTKVFVTFPYIIGVAGSWRANAAVRFASLPVPPLGVDVFRFMAQDFLKALDGIVQDDKEYGMLVGLRGRLFHVYGGKMVSEELLDFEACGKAAQVARGAMHAVDKALSAEERVRVGLEAAERFCADVRGPFNILRLDR